ncbi:MAG: hypothetical protein IJO71_09210 [Microbacterium sp.]|uniref:hypothetical protein n=1 Tax=Microbacterium sp. TaxID=51671 RepID=UPI0025FBBB1A|nr:hypothetical protein [Microbacterium sp.]MBQ9917364.1 hypothetical protein [Microbacterium sp.]
MPTTLEQSRKTVDAYAEAQASLVAALLRILLGRWSGFTHWGRPDLVRAHAARSAVDIDIGLAQIRAASRAYMVTRLTQLDVAPRSLPEVVDTYERGGTDLLTVYQRPARERNFVERRELADGASPAEAEEKAQRAFENRLRRVVEQDVQATARDETNRVLSAAPKVIGYRRIIHPELSKTGTCGLCVVAANRLYSVAELMELHGGCKCTVDAVTDTSDPGLALNREDLDAIYKAAGDSTYADQLKRIRIASYEHGELGPILVRAGDKFRTLEDVQRDTKTSEEPTPFARQSRAADQRMWKSQRDTSERAIRYLLNAKSRGADYVDIAGHGEPVAYEDIDAAIQYHRDLIARAQRHAA